MRREVVLPFRWSASERKPATALRSTWILSSIQTLKARGHFDRYAALLPEAHSEAILLAVGGVWLPMPVARAHYEACDRLGLPHEEILAMGVASGERAQGTVIRTALRSATGAGVTPWTILTNAHALWARGADGGDLCVTRLGPKEASLEVIGCELFEVPYFRTALRGVFTWVVQQFSTRAFVNDVTPRGRRIACTLLFQWA
jgi:hypothetical protein